MNLPKKLQTFRILALTLLAILAINIFAQNLKIALANYQPYEQPNQQSQQNKLQKIKNLINVYYLKNRDSREELYKILKNLTSYSSSDPKKEKIKRWIINQIKKSKYDNLSTMLKLDQQDLSPPPSRCMRHFNQLDELGIAQNFPPELIIATWYRENSCKPTNPLNNHFGIFQINNGKYYTPGKYLTTGEIIQQAQDFINFSKHKRNYYARLKKLHSDFGKDNIDISYLHYSILDLQLHAITYNGITKWTHPTTNLYANANLHPNKKQAKDWVVTMTLKILKYLKNPSENS